IPIIHMIRETVHRLKKNEHRIQGKTKIGILATDGTIRMKLYQRECEAAGIEPYILSPEKQKLVMKIIYEGIKGGEEIQYEDFQAIEDELRDAACHGAIMGCTELSCFKQMYHLEDYYIDAMRILAETSIISCGKKIKK
ncbi:MAG: amino acid racemase, partial [Anaerovorax sp.]